MNISDIIILVLIGLFAGTVGGSFGVGGGIIIVPALVFFFGLNQHSAQGTSLAVLMFPVAIIGAYNYYKSGFVNVKYVLILVLAFAVGQYLGSMLAIHLSEKILRRIFGFFVLAVGLKLVLGK